MPGSAARVRARLQCPPPGPATVPQATWQLWQGDSADEAGGGYAATTAAFDGDPLTFWRSRGQPAPTILPTSYRSIWADCIS